MIGKQSGIFNYTVGELIEELKKYPKDIPENMYWDGDFQIDENGIDALLPEREEGHD